MTGFSMKRNAWLEWIKILGYYSLRKYLFKVNSRYTRPTAPDALLMPLMVDFEKIYGYSGIFFSKSQSKLFQIAGKIETEVFLKVIIMTVRRQLLSILLFKLS